MGEEGVAGIGPAGAYAGGGGDLAEAEEPPPADGSEHVWRGLGCAGMECGNKLKAREV